MSIRAIAQEVYKCQARVHKLEDQLKPADYAAQESIKEELRQARAELKVVKNMLEGRKSQAADVKRRFPFIR
jgi:3'-phosphoadenosine 5'-phosphosulfate (PAPS) 3'-phosphatase